MNSDYESAVQKWIETCLDKYYSSRFQARELVMGDEDSENVLKNGGQEFNKTKTLSNKQLTKMSCSFSQILRHRLHEHPHDSQGFVNVDVLLKEQQGRTLDHVREIVANDKKTRFALQQRGEQWFIRANQGHTSGHLNDEEMLTVLDYPIIGCFHGTFSTCIDSIKKSGLSRMERNHIHIAESDDAKSGKRATCDVKILINMELAMKDGIKFYKSTNGVILTSGNDQGFLLPKYFLRIEYIGKEGSTKDKNDSKEVSSEMPLEAIITDDDWDEEHEHICLERLEAQGKGTVSDFWRDKYITGSEKYWNEFYKRNADNFYKDRHYLHREWPEILANVWESEEQQEYLDFLEVGCGVGNAVTPLLDLNASLRVFAFDLSERAIEILRAHPLKELHPDRLHPFVYDIASAEAEFPPSNVFPKQVDLILCLFVLSAIEPSSIVFVLKRLNSLLKEGGKVLFRDYGRFDEAQLRFKKTSKIEENFYVRQDGTCSYFFELEETNAWFREAGFEPEEGRIQYIRKQQNNRLQDRSRYRVWLQGVYKKVS